MGLFEDLWAAGAHNQIEQINESNGRIQAITSKAEPAIAAERYFLMTRMMSMARRHMSFFFLFGGKRRDEECGAYIC
jgi:hypothetical protein